MREERKRVTALFADVVDSTALAESLDPEDTREVLGSVIERIIFAVEACGGTVKDLAGDGVLALFGAPQSHEDDELRAVLCGLRILEEVQNSRRDPAHPQAVEMKVRVGIDTGTVVVGPVGASRRVEYGAVGDAVNTAARLHARAAPDTVLVSAATRGWVVDHFDWGQAENHRLKGKSQPVRAHRVLKAKGGTPRSAAPAAARLVGRASEMRLLRNHIDDVVAGRGRVLFVIGEPGVGKSRLLQEWADASRTRVAERGRWAEVGCEALGSMVPLLPFRNAVRQLLALPDGPAAAGVLRGRARSTDVPFLAHLLELSAADPSLTTGLAGMSAEDIQRRVFDAVTGVLVDQQAKRSTVMVIEDLHWADPSSVLLLEQLVRAVPTGPLLVVATLRPEVDTAAWLLEERLISSAVPGVATLTLDRLPPDEAEDLVDRLAGGTALPPMVKSRILETAEGNPLFLQQIVRYFEDRGILARYNDGSPHLTAPESFEVPPRLEKVITSRIDRLDDTCYEVLSVAAVIGPRFTATLLERSARTRVGVQEALAQLCRRQLLSRLVGDEYEFGHVLIQQTVVQTLLKRRRRELHAMVGEALASLYGDETSDAALSIGQHYAQAALPDRAAPYLLAAADRARASFANEEAAALYAEVLTVTTSLVEQDQSRWAPVALSALEGLGEVQMLLGRYAEAAETYERGFVEAGRCADAVASARLRRLVGSARVLQHRHQEAEGAYDEADAVLQGLEPRDDQWWHEWFEIRDARADLAYWRDDDEEQRRILDEVRGALDEHGSPERRAEFYWMQVYADLRTHRFRLPRETMSVARSAMTASMALGSAYASAWARFQMGFALLWAGELASADVELRAAHSYAEDTGDRLLRARSSAYLVVTHRLMGDVRRVEEWLRRSDEAAAAAGRQEYHAMGHANRAWLDWRATRLESARSEALAALTMWESMTPRYAFDWMALWPLIGTALERGELEEALARSRMLGADSQQLPPPELHEHLEQAWAAGRAGDAARASAAMQVAARLARTLNYL